MSETTTYTPECPRCHESHEALARERERTYSAATEMLNAARLSCSVLGDMLAARAVLGAAPSETVQEAAARVVSERDEARAETIEARRLRASLATAEGIYEDALVILCAADGESLTEAAARVVSERDEVRAEVARMRDQRDRAELMDAAVAVRAARIEREAREVETLRRERDAAREEAARLRDAIDARDAEAVQLAEEEAERQARRHADIDRLRAIIDGRNDPPSAAEVVVHGEAGGAWLAFGQGALWQVERPGALLGWMERWWPRNAKGYICAWPVVTATDEVTP